MVELLSPAGNPESFRAAIDSGADAVYMGLQSFGARAGADNFNTEDYCSCLDYAHLYDKKIYLTLNTLIKQSEISEAVDCIRPLYEAGLDGIIVQDIGLASLISKIYPHLHIHASTQMNVVNSYGANYLKELGITRIVPGRECSLQEIIDIKNNSGLEVESFIHGAMCYSYSGQCLFSAYLGGRSGNRGRCAGTCRLPYNNGTYPLSLKDMCTIEHIGELVDAGIDSFKIEGRLKSPLYVAGVTSIYRKYIDRHIQGEDTRVSKSDMNDLASLYLRSEKCTGYYYQHNNADMVSLHNPAYNNDAKKLSSLEIKYLNPDNHKKLEVYMRASFDVGKNCSLYCKYKDTEVSVQGPVIEAGIARSATYSEVEKNLSKLGETEFTLGQLDIELGDNCFIPVSVLNSLRRSGIETLKESILKNSRRDDRVGQIQKCDIQGKIETADRGIIVSVRSIEQLSVALTFSLQAIIIPGELLIQGLVDSESIDCNTDTKIIIALPRIFRQRSDEFFKDLSKIIKSSKIKGVLAKNIEELQWLKIIDYQGEIWADYSLYSYNRYSLGQFLKCCSRICAPLELTLRQMQDLEFSDLIVNVYGHAPLMVSANCIVRTLEKCNNERIGNKRILRDRMGKGHIVLTNCVHCYNEILNAVPSSLHNNIDKLKKSNIYNYRIDLTVEDAKVSQRIINSYVNGGDLGISETTTGLFNKGVM